MRPRILFLADINSPHTQKWAIALSKSNFEIGIFSFNNSNLNWMQSHQNIKCLYQSKHKQINSIYGKSKYLMQLLRLFYIILKFKPQVIHTHYISSYGLLGALTFFKPFVVSAWGTDITHFPKKSFLHRFSVKFVLWRADKICVSSSILKEEIKKYSKKSSTIIPFGINLNEFYQFKNVRKTKNFTFGCIKLFEKIYNLDKVVEAFYLLSIKYPESCLKLKLVGDGSMKEKIKERVIELGIITQVEFTGWVEHKLVAQQLNSLDVLINVSEYESFGVSVAEAMACRVPVIISGAEGFKDLVPDIENAFIAASTSPQDIFQAMESCFLNIELRNMAVNISYDLIKKKFDLVNNLKQMEHVYSELISS
jgi:glycosyltransferase involved in cell wall biosynthesis